MFVTNVFLASSTNLVILHMKPRKREKFKQELEICIGLYRFAIRLILAVWDSVTKILNIKLFQSFSLPHLLVLISKYKTFSFT